MQLQEVDQYGGECPKEIAGGNGNEHDGQEWDTHVHEGEIVQSSREDTRDDARYLKLRVES